MAMELKHLNPQHVMDVTGKAIDEISRLRAENAELKEKYKDMDITHTVHIAKMNARIEDLESALESEKASHYADSVDAGMRERRLKRALWSARAERAREAFLKWNLFPNFETVNKLLTIDEYDETPGATDGQVLRTCIEWIKVWNNVERKCREKADEYK